jgi:hypothetical protein
MSECVYHYSEDTRRTIVALLVVFGVGACVCVLLLYQGIIGGAVGTGVCVAFLVGVLGMVAALFSGGVFESTVTADRVTWKTPRRGESVCVGEIVSVEKVAISMIHTKGGSGMHASCPVLTLKDGRKISIDSAASGNTDDFVAAVQWAMARQQTNTP